MYVKDKRTYSKCRNIGSKVLEIKRQHTVAETVIVESTKGKMKRRTK